MLLLLLLHICDLTTSSTPLLHPGLTTTPSPGFASKTSYPGRGEVRALVPPGCRVGMAWVVARHGTRNPSTEDIKHMVENLPVLRGRLVVAGGNGEGELGEEEVEALVRWRWGREGEVGNHLTESGALEHWGLGRRWGERLGGAPMSHRWGIGTGLGRGQYSVFGREFWIP